MEVLGTWRFRVGVIASSGRQSGSDFFPRIERPKGLQPGLTGNWDRRAQILNTVAIQKRQLHLSEGLPCAFVELVGELLSVDPKQRPSFEAVKQKLEAIKAAGYQGQTSLCRSSLVRPSCGMPAPIPAIQEEVVSA